MQNSEVLASTLSRVDLLRVMFYETKPKTAQERTLENFEAFSLPLTSSDMQVIRN